MLQNFCSRNAAANHPENYAAKNPLQLVWISSNHFKRCCDEWILKSSAWQGSLIFAVRSVWEIGKLDVTVITQERGRQPALTHHHVMTYERWPMSLLPAQESQGCWPVLICHEVWAPAGLRLAYQCGSQSTLTHHHIMSTGPHPLDQEHPTVSIWHRLCSHYCHDFCWLWSHDFFEYSMSYWIQMNADRPNWL